MNRSTLILLFTISVLLGNLLVSCMEGDSVTDIKEQTTLAKQGDARAQVNLGRMYYKGKGVPQDYVLAHMWSNLSASTGNESAEKNRDIVAKQLTPADLSAAQKLARECVAKNYKGC